MSEKNGSAARSCRSRPEDRACHSRKRDDWSAERAINDGRRIGDQREPGSGERRKAKTDQHGRSHRHRRSETSCALEEASEKAIKKQLQSAIFADSADRALENFELAFLIGELVEK